jgi:hypothetical protein
VAYNEKPQWAAQGARMDITDFMLVKLIVLVGIVVVYNFWQGFKGGPP